MTFVKTLGVSVFITLLSVSTSAFAGLTTVATYIEKANDCNGYMDEDTNIGFGNGSAPGNSFGDCKIFHEDNGVEFDIAWVIAKFEKGPNTYIEGEKYDDSIEKNDWHFQNKPEKHSPRKKGLGTWDFANPSVDVFYWTAKAGNGFNLFWTVDDSSLNSDCKAYEGTLSTIYDENLNLGCLNAAVAVNEGVYMTPGKKDLSHITFFGKEGPVPTEVVQVSEPGTTLLFALGLAGIFAARRKQK